MLKAYEKPAVARVNLIPMEAHLGYCKIEVCQPSVGIGPLQNVTCCDPNGCKDQGS